ncbi:MAG: SCO family protein [Proteobacteria bacterium]|nr:SCO family protein [Pseudomonadota bacterium]
MPASRSSSTVWTIVAALLGAVVVAMLVLAGRLYMTSDDPAATSGSGVASIGGPFTLIDHTGRTVTDKDFAGRWMLVYFGYTYCPDVCPTSLSVMADAMDRLDPEQAEKVVPVMISIDPLRDTPALLAEYVTNFHPRLIGLTGSVDQAAAAAKTYRVYFAKSGGSDAGDDYLMDHSSIVYLVDPKGQFRLHFAGAQIDAERIAERLRQLL